MTDEQRLVYIFKQFAKATQQIVDAMLEESSSLIVNHPEWYEIEVENRSGGVDKVCAEGEDLGKLLEEAVPPIEDAATQVESAGFDWWYLMDCLATYVWKIVRNRIEKEMECAISAKVEQTDDIWKCL